MRFFSSLSSKLMLNAHGLILRPLLSVQQNSGVGDTAGQDPDPTINKNRIRILRFDF